MRIKKKKQLIVDLQSGFGNPLNTYYAAKKLEKNGGDILLLNDQTYPSYTTEKPAVTTQEDLVGKVRASLDSFENPQTQLWVKLEGLHEYGIEGFKQRVRYTANAGAHAIVVSHYSPEELQILSAQHLEIPLLAVSTEKIQEDRPLVRGWLDQGRLVEKANDVKRQIINEWQ